MASGKAGDFFKKQASNIKNKASDSLKSSTSNNSNNSDNLATNQADQMTERLQNKTKDINNKIKNKVENKVKDKVKDKITKGGTKAAKKGAKSAGKATKKAANKAGKTAAKTIGKAAKSAGKAIGKAASKVASKIAQGVAKLVSNPYFWLAIAIIGGIFIFLMLFWFLFMGFSNANKGSQEDYLVDYNGHKIAIEADWKERLVTSYYMTYADRSYYYTIDDDSTVYQADINKNKVQDKYLRESSFALNVKLIQYLDEQMNKDMSYPEQFIKPVYNTCSTGESTDGYCKTKQLTDKEDNLSVISQGYKHTSGCYTDDNGEERCNAHYVIDKEQNTFTSSSEIGVSSWGLAPILHYKKYTEKKWVQDMQVKNVKYYDLDTEEEKSCTYKNCPDDIKELLKTETTTNDIDENGKISGEKINTDVIKDGKVRETEKEVYLIDSVATMVGTVSNEIEEKTEATGEKYTNNIIIPKQQSKVISINDKIATNEDWIKDATIVFIRAVKLNDSDANKLREADGIEEGETTKKTKTNFGFLTVTMTTTYYYNGYTFDEFEKNLNDANFSVLNSDQMNTLSNGNSILFGNTIVTGIPVTLNDCVSITTDNKGIYTCKKEDGNTVNANLNDYRVFNYNGTNYTGSASTYIKHSEGDVNSLKDGIKATKTFNFVYSVTGDYWSTEYKYKSSSPNIEKIDNGDYLKTYLENYEVYVPSNNTNRVDSGDLTERIKENLENAEGIIGDLNDEQASQIKYESELGKLIIKLYGNRIFLDRNAFIAANIKDITDKEKDDSEVGKESDTSSTDNSDISLGENANKWQQCIIGLKGYRDTLGNNNAYSLLEQYSNFYGVDVDIMVAIAANNGCNIGSSPTPWDKSFSTTNTNDYGIFGFKKTDINKSYTAFNYVTNEYDTFTIPLTGRADADIRAAVMKMSNLIDKYNGNLIIAIQAYESGAEVMDNILNVYSSQEQQEISLLYQDSGYYNTGWLAYRETLGIGDSKYLEKVLSYLPNSKSSSSIKANNNAKSYIFSLIAPTQNLSTNDFQDVVYYTYWYKNKNTIYNNWDLLYPWKNKGTINYNVGKDSFPINDYEKNLITTNPDTAFDLIQNKETGDTEIKMVMAHLLSSLDGTAVEDNLEISDLEWKKKFVSLFSTGIVKMEIDEVKLSKYFNEIPDEPIKDVFAVYRGFNSSYNINGTVNRYTDILIQAEAGTEVRAVAKGTVTSINNDCITIDHSKEKSEYRVETEYCQIDIDSEIKLGNEINQGKTIGKIKDETDLIDDNIENAVTYLSFGFIIDDSYEDGSVILRAAKLEKYYNNITSLTNGGMIKEANEGSHKMLEYSLEHIDELDKLLEPINLLESENWELLDKLNSTKYYISSLSWWRFHTYNDGSSVHGGMDFVPTNHSCSDGTPFCNYIHSIGPGILLKYDDGYPDNGFLGNYGANNGAGNYVQVLYRGENNHLYVFSFIHLHQTATTNAFNDLESSFLEEGQIIGITGHSGNSSGMHQHVEIVDYGDISLQEFFEFWKTKIDRLYIRIWDANNSAYWCENTSVRPCFQRPLYIFKNTATRAALSPLAETTHCPIDTDEKKASEENYWVEITSKGC